MVSASDLIGLNTQLVSSWWRGKDRIHVIGDCPICPQIRRSPATAISVWTVLLRCGSGSGLSALFCTDADHASHHNVTHDKSDSNLTDLNQYGDMHTSYTTDDESHDEMDVMGCSHVVLMGYMLIRFWKYKRMRQSPVRDPK